MASPSQTDATPEAGLLDGVAKTDAGQRDACGRGDAQAEPDASSGLSPDANGGPATTDLHVADLTGHETGADDNRRPVLSNFRVESAQPDRIYFDSSEVILATTAKGFIVTDRTVTGIHIKTSSITGHYLTVATGFTFWDNTAIRYTGGSDLRDLQGNKVYEFTLRYVENHIPEPPAAATRFVTPAASGKGDGSSESAPWTLAQAGSNAKAGQTVWIKAGDYGAAPLLIGQSGTAASPIKFIGYRATPGDKPSLPRTQDTVFSASVMPYIHSSSTSGSGVNLAGKRFIIIKNIQIAGFYDSLLATGNASDCLIENVYARGARRSNLNFFAAQTRRVRSKGCYTSNAAGTGLWIAGDYNLIDNLYACSRGTPNMDYYVSLYGGTTGTGNIVRNTAVVRDPKDSHSGHGISVKGGGRPLEHTLIENSTVQEVAQAIELRHHYTRYTVVRNVVATGNRASASNLVTFRDGTSYNVVENSLAKGVYCGVLFTDNNEEDGGNQPGGLHNQIINTIFDSCRIAVQTSCITGPSGVACKPLPSTDNEFLNCTFYGSDYMFSLRSDFADTNRMTNCTFVKVAQKTSGSGSPPAKSYSHCDSWNSWGAVAGTSNVSLDPKFVDASKGNFHLHSSSPIRNLGADLTGIHYDKDGVERLAGQYSIGAYE